MGQFESDAAAKASQLEDYVTQKAHALGLAIEISKVAEQWPWSADDMAWRGRASDLCILGLPQTGAEGRINVEDWLFGAGRPCILYPDDSRDGFQTDSVLVAWDFSKAATRALSDSLPILKIAKNVRILTVRGEKKIHAEDVKAPVQALLAAHEIKAEFIEVEIGAHPMGRTILGEAQNAHASLIVMGAYGHSRLKEFVLGGATKEILNTTRIPLLMSQ